ncbi:unnamed protein product [Dovyalis caffra]|uniref:Uncharacterized protein n=1 Tax=Dovyalis caffra TaxID=77055 RepID=A0AAV1QU69_9ROSI|nr:unnamed protein product [Dovyalis caffra]
MHKGPRYKNWNKGDHTAAAQLQREVHVTFASYGRGHAGTGETIPQQRNCNVKFM